MISDPILQRNEQAVQKLRADIVRLSRDEGEARERANRAMRRIQVDLERDLAQIKRRQQDLEREIFRQEQEIERKQKELERLNQNRT